jgi:hypothetical protein
MICTRGGYITHRHNNLRDIIGKACVDVGYAAGAQLGSICEVHVPNGEGRVKRIDLELRSYRRNGDGATLVCGVDFTVTHALSSTNILHAPPYKPGYAAGHAAARKRRMYTEYVRGRPDYTFCPAAWEAYGRIGVDALQLIRDIGKSDWVTQVWGAREGLSPRRAVMQYTFQLLQTCNIEIMRSAAERCILDRIRVALRQHNAALHVPHAPLDAAL